MKEYQALIEQFAEESRSMTDLFAEIGPADDEYPDLYMALLEAEKKSINILKMYETIDSGRWHRKAMKTLGELLPRLSASTGDIIDCLCHLIREYESIGAGYRLGPAYIDYCAADIHRPVRAVELIKREPETRGVLLRQSIVAGARIDSNDFVDQAIALAADRSPILAKGAISSLYSIISPESHDAQDRVLDVFEKIAHRKIDGEVMSAMVSTAFHIFGRQERSMGRFIALLRRCLAVDSSNTMDVLIDVFASEQDDLSDELLDFLVDHIQGLKEISSNTVDRIDLGIYDLITRRGPHEGLALLEETLLANEVDVRSFDSTVNHLLRDGLLAKIVTKWLCSDSLVLRTSAARIVEDNVYIQDQVSIDKEELPGFSLHTMLSLSRVCVGYLFNSPVAAASMIVSAMSVVEDGQPLDNFQNLLIDPLLPAHSDEVGAYLGKQLSGEIDKRIQEACQGAIDEYEKRQTTLRELGSRPELHPSLRQREAYNRRMSQKIDDAIKAEEENSILTQIAYKRTMLYGVRIISYDSEMNLQEIPMTKFSDDLAIPIYLALDPLGLDYRLKLFKRERVEA